MNNFFLILSLLLLISCKSTKALEQQEKVENFVTIHTVDSIEVRDSIYVYEAQDTVFMYKEHTKIKYVQKIDTVEKVVEVQSVQEIKQQESKLSVILKILGVLFIVLIIVCFIIKLKR